MKKLLISGAALAACAVPFVAAVSPAAAATPAISCTFNRLAQGYVATAFLDHVSVIH